MRLFGKIIGIIARTDARTILQLAYCTYMHLHLVHYEIFDVKLLNIYVCAISPTTSLDICIPGRCYGYV